ncbi:hypothetical protein FRC91_11645 [Bradymonadales bacterium TMQ1]|nr:hypothetical protein FRC91_11645 [Bradymonadales bacterium TMQ1]
MVKYKIPVMSAAVLLVLKGCAVTKPDGDYRNLEVDVNQVDFESMCASSDHESAYLAKVVWHAGGFNRNIQREVEVHDEYVVCSETRQYPSRPIYKVQIYFRSGSSEVVDLYGSPRGCIEAPKYLIGDEIEHELKRHSTLNRVCGVRRRFTAHGFVWESENAGSQSVTLSEERAEKARDALAGTLFPPIDLTIGHGISHPIEFSRRPEVPNRVLGALVMESGAEPPLYNRACGSALSNVERNELFHALLGLNLSERDGLDYFSLYVSLNRHVLEQYPDLESLGRIGSGVSGASRVNQWMDNVFVNNCGFGN